LLLLPVCSYMQPVRRPPIVPSHYRRLCLRGPTDITPPCDSSRIDDNPKSFSKRTTCFQARVGYLVCTSVSSATRPFRMPVLVKMKRLRSANLTSSKVFCRGDSFLRLVLPAVSRSRERKASYPSPVSRFFNAVSLSKSLFELSIDRNGPRTKIRSSFASLLFMSG